VPCTLPLQCSPAGACTTACNDGGSTSCTNGKECCGGLCIDTQSDVNNCGACNNKCGAGQTRCCSKTCSNPLTDKNNCGGCGTACGTLNASATSCTNAACKPTCNAGFGHCTTATTGCETNLTNATKTCGSCTNDCTIAVKNATGITCQGTACRYQSCTNYHYDKNQTASDGCEGACGANGVAPCCPNGPACMGGLSCNNGHGYCK
jgi:hypothetical protein